MGMGLGLYHVVCFSMHEALGSIPSTVKQTKNVLQRCGRSKCGKDGVRSQTEGWQIQRPKK
jgi:hypothetical protein